MVQSFKEKMHLSRRKSANDLNDLSAVPIVKIENASSASNAFIGPTKATMEEQAGSATSINSFASALSNFPVNVEKPRENIPLQLLPSRQQQQQSQQPQTPIGRSQFLLGFANQSAANTNSRLPTGSSCITVSDIQHNQQRLFRHNSSLKQHQQQHQQAQDNFLRVPSFLLSPPTPSPSASAISMNQSTVKQLYKIHRGELTASEQYRYALSRAQLKAASRTSALLSGFAMIALVELMYQRSTPHFLLICVAVVTTLLVSVHLLTLLMSTCLLPYIEAHGCTKDSPHVKLKFYVELSWIFSTCIGLILFLLEIVLIFFVKFEAIGFDYAAWITTGILLPMLAIFIIVSYLIRRTVLSHFMERMADKVCDLQEVVANKEHQTMANGAIPPTTMDNFSFTSQKKISSKNI